MQRCGERFGVRFEVILPHAIVHGRCGAAAALHFGREVLPENRDGDVGGHERDEVAESIGLGAFRFEQFQVERRFALIALREQYSAAASHVGDVVEVAILLLVARLRGHGRLLAHSNFLTENGKEFDYINYLKKDGILYTLEAKKLEIIDIGKGNLIKSLLFNIKNTFVAKINTLIFPYESTLLGGLILGEKSSFPNSLREDFIKTGTIHIVALSGYNVTIISEWFIKLLYFLPTVLAFYGGILVIILFVIMTGVEATAVRAGIMAILVLIARNLGRQYDIVRALIVTVVFMLLFNPYLLYYDVSFQLSFISTIAVIFFTPRIEKYFQFVTNKFNLRDIVAVTFSAYVFVLPFVLYKMGNLSLVALPTNILVLPFIPITMLLGFLSGVLAFFSFYLALPFSYITHLFLYYELNIIKFFASIPFSSFVILDFPIILTILIYLYFIYFLFRRGIKVFFTEDFT